MEEKYKLYHGDYRDVLQRIDIQSIGAIITDPPYPDYYEDEYQYFDGIIDFLNQFTCRQFVFWSAKVDFPLSYTAIHIWDKKTGAGSEYERIFERNGKKNYKVFRHYFINSTVAASFTGDVFTGHPSQKPKQLLMDIIAYAKFKDRIIFDPFMGTGSAGVASIVMGNKFIGIEKKENYFGIARERIKKASIQDLLFTNNIPDNGKTMEMF